MISFSHALKNQYLPPKTFNKSMPPNNSSVNLNSPPSINS